MSRIHLIKRYLFLSILKPILTRYFIPWDFRKPCFFHPFARLVPVGERRNLRRMFGSAVLGALHHSLRNILRKYSLLDSSREHFALDKLENQMQQMFLLLVFFGSADTNLPFQLLFLFYLICPHELFSVLPDALSLGHYPSPLEVLCVLDQSYLKGECVLQKGQLFLPVLL